MTEQAADTEGSEGSDADDRCSRGGAFAIFFSLVLRLVEQLHSTTVGSVNIIERQGDRA